LRRIEKLGDVLNRNVVAEDVTEQYMDAEVRLKNARAVRDRLQQLLEKATKVEDSLAIEKELTRIGNEIETLEGKLKYLRDRAQYSTITVRFQPKASDTVKPSVRLPVDWLNQLGLGRLLDL
jgi:predicted  nucleic acid-binding Zn-ribbon protein